MSVWHIQYTKTDAVMIVKVKRKKRSEKGSIKYADSQSRNTNVRPHQRHEIDVGSIPQMLISYKKYLYKFLYRTPHHRHSMAHLSI